MNCERIRTQLSELKRDVNFAAKTIGRYNGDVADVFTAIAERLARIEKELT